MVLDWAGERYVLVYNGELYNTEEVRNRLIQEGHCFKGHSDTEVVLHAYAQWGAQCLHEFNGIFAFAVWEEVRKRLFLARDRIGVKPLFYWCGNHRLIFASEIKTILASSLVTPTLDEQGAAEIMLLGPGRTPGCGIFHGVLELEPGCCGWFEDGSFRVSRYWRLTDREHTDSFEDTVDHVRFLVEDSIRRQMVSDVPIGTFLSGGLDSSLICAVCAREMESRGEQLKTFSVDYEGNAEFFVPGKFQPNSDTGYIKLMQNTLNTSHHWTVLTPEQLLAELESATIARDLPGMADVDFSLLAFCAEIRNEVTVALSGECADEIFGGYPWYRDPEGRALDGFPWAQNAQQRSDLMCSSLQEKLKPMEYIQDRYTQTCRESDILPDNSPRERRMKEMVNLNFRWFMQTLLDRKDRMSMHNSLEVRVPFCDYRITEYLYGVPWDFKDHGGFEKGLLRTAMSGLIPNEILWRKKSPYPKTFNPRFRTLVTERFSSLLQDLQSPLWEIADRTEAANLLTSDHLWPWYGQLMKGTQTMIYLLQTDFWLRHYRIDFNF
jgi:asparagine synthase (glutamine-hydrolysing)